MLSTAKQTRLTCACQQRPPSTDKCCWLRMQVAHWVTTTRRHEYAACHSEARKKGVRRPMRKQSVTVRRKRCALQTRCMHARHSPLQNAAKALTSQPLPPPRPERGLWQDRPGPQQERTSRVRLPGALRNTPQALLCNSCALQWPCSAAGLRHADGGRRRQHSRRARVPLVCRHGLWAGSVEARA